MNIPIDIRIDHKDWELLKAEADENHTTPSDVLRQAIAEARDPERFAETLRNLVTGPLPDDNNPTKNTMIRIPVEDIPLVAGYALRLGTTNNRIIQMLVKGRVQGNKQERTGDKRGPTTDPLA